MPNSITFLSPWCEHDLEIIGVPYTTWTGHGTADPPPRGCPIYVNSRCRKCGGEKILYTGKTTP